MGDIAERIAAARKEAEALKERIKQKKDALADTTCAFPVMVCREIIRSTNIRLARSLQ